MPCHDDGIQTPCVATKETDKHKQCLLCDGYYENTDDEHAVEVKGEERHPCYKCGEISKKMSLHKHTGNYECRKCVTNRLLFGR